MKYILIAALVALFLFGAMLALLEIGSRLGARKLADDPDSGTATRAMEAAIFALLGLLLAFTFSGAASRFDQRRHLIVQEANAIGTAYLRLDLLPSAAQPELRDAFKRYVDRRIAAYQALPDMAAARVELGRATELQQLIWTKAVAAVTAPGSPTPPATLVLPALNAMIDITTTRTLAAEMHPPPVVFGLLFGLMLLGALLAGYGMAGAKTRNWLHRLAFAFTLAGAGYVILDFEYPRLGLIRVDAFDHTLADVRKSMQ